MHAEFESSVLKRYAIEKTLNQSPENILLKGIDLNTKEPVLIKKLLNVFQTSLDSQRIFREVMYLQEISCNPNIIHLLNIMRAENDRDIYLVFEYLDSDLKNVIQGNILEPIHKKFIAYQLIKTLKFLHSGQLIHRKLNPESILLNSECVLKLSDFSLIRSVSAQQEGLNPVLTDFACNRWYQAPETILGNSHYSKPVDIWAAGCIIAEMLSGRPLFPGISTLHQLECIVEVLGVPSPQDIQEMSGPLGSVIEDFSNKNSKDLKNLLKTDDVDAIELVRAMLSFNPKNRITAEEALEYSWLMEFRNEDEEETCPYTIRISIDDNIRMTIKDYRDKIYQEIVRRKNEIRRRDIINRY